MSEFLRPQQEALRQESLTITPESLYEDNHSALADERRQEFEDARRKGIIKGVVRCSDARVSMVGNSISVGTISAAGIPGLNLINDRSLEAWVSLSHFDGDTVRVGVMPEGCGGLKAKEQIGDEPRDSGIEKYISEIVKTKDPIIQSLLTAEVLARQGEVPVLAAAQDHLNHQIFPLAVFQKINGQMRIDTAVLNIDIFRYDPRRIYANGIPTIDENGLPDVFVELLEQNKHDMQATLSKYPDLHNLQKVQRPRMVMFSTDIRSAKIKYPKTSSIPGSIFKTFVHRQKIDGGIYIPEEDLLKSIYQFEYPIDHAGKHAGDPSQPFSNTDRILIETANMEESINLARKALEYPWMKKWTTLPDRKIITIQTVGGIVSDIKEFAA